MQALGFKNAAGIDFSQLAVLVFFILILFGIAFFLKKKKALILALKHGAEINEPFSVQHQKIDRLNSVYKLADKNRTYIIFQTPQQVVLLDKIERHTVDE